MKSRVTFEKNSEIENELLKLQRKTEEFGSMIWRSRVKVRRVGGDGYGYVKPRYLEQSGVKEGKSLTQIWKSLFRKRMRPSSACSSPTKLGKADSMHESLSEKSLERPKFRLGKLQKWKFNNSSISNFGFEKEIKLENSQKVNPKSTFHIRSHSKFIKSSTSNSNQTLGHKICSFSHKRLDVSQKFKNNYGANSIEENSYYCPNIQPVKCKAKKRHKKQRSMAAGAEFGRTRLYSRLMAKRNRPYIML